MVMGENVNGREAILEVNVRVNQNSLKNRQNLLRLHSPLNVLF